VRVAKEAMEFSSLSGPLDFFLGKVSVLMGDAKWEDDCSRCTCKSGGNGGCGIKLSSHKLTGEDPSIILLDRTGAEGSASGLDMKMERSFLVMGMGVGSSMGWRRSMRALVTEREAPESSIKDVMIGASEGCYC